MTHNQSDQNRNRGEGGLFLPGCKPGPGRPKGSGNILTMSMKDSIMEAFWEVGGVSWLVKLAQEEPAVYARLLLQLLPRPSAEAEEGDGRPYIDPDDEIH